MLKKIAQKLKSLKDIAIVTHENPDGDALGSSFALKFALEKLGIKADVVLEKEINSDFKFTGWTPLVYKENIIAENVVGVDFNEPTRTGACTPLFANAKEKAIVDHHICKTEPCELFLSDHTAAAAGELVFELINELGVEIDKNIATALYISIMSDTGGCKFGNTTAKTHTILAKLIDKVDVSYVCRMLFDITPLRKLELSTKLISEIEFYAGGKIGVISAENLLPEDEHYLNDMANRALNVEGCQIGVFFKQRADIVKVSLRTLGEIDAAKICSSFGGGGHKNAAGCGISKPFATAKEEFIRELMKWI